MDDVDWVVDELRALASKPIDADLQARHLARLVATSARAARRRRRRVGIAVGGAFLICSTGLAAADALPDPVQQVAHAVLDQVGIPVPEPSEPKPTAGSSEDDPARGARGPGSEARPAAPSDACTAEPPAAPQADDSAAAPLRSCAGGTPAAEDRGSSPDGPAGTNPATPVEPDKAKEKDKDGPATPTSIAEPGSQRTVPTPPEQAETRATQPDPAGRRGPQAPATGSGVH
jgi:hypothetical protein